MGNYLENLTIRLASGLTQLPESYRALHGEYFRAAQNPDGGFPGREGGSDLYYTSFALRSLACLNRLDAAVTGGAAEFLRQRLKSSASVVDFMSLLYAARIITSSGGPDVLSEGGTDWPERVQQALEGFRKPDGGYAKATEGSAGSTYHTFLVALCYELMGSAIPQPDRVAAFLLSRRREDGGFVEVAPARRGGTNPTAAAVALLLMLDSLDDPTRQGAVAFLSEMQSDDGGLRANGRVPLADLLSTFTAVLTLVDLGAVQQIDSQAVRGFLQANEQQNGGFRAGLWDETADVEYSFYGLGTAALLVD